MARISYPTPQQLDQSGGLVQRIAQERGGKLLNLYRMLLHSPAFAEGWRALLTAVRQGGVLPAALRELVILRVAVLNKAPYEFETHVPFALAAGLMQMQVAALRQHEFAPNLFNEKQGLVLRYVDAMTTEVQVSEALVLQLEVLFDARELVELTVTVAAYNMVSRFLEALGVDHD